MEKWYEKKFRRNLVDMHISEFDDTFLSKFDSKKYVQNLVKAQVQVAYIYTNNCLGVSFVPTKVGHQHKNLVGRDIIKELIDECEKNDIQPVLYCNYWSRYMYDLHHDWRCVIPDGRTSKEFIKPYGRFGVCCMNSPFQKYFEKLITELVLNYKTEGLWIDMSGAFMLCTCPHCRKRFKDETGYDLPDKINWGDKVWNLFAKKRLEWVADSLEKLNKAVKKVNPNIVVLHNSARYVQNNVRGLTSKYYEKSEFVTGDYTAGRQYHSFFSKFFYTVSSNKPAEFLCPVMADLVEHNVIKTKNQLSVLLYSSMANNVRFGFIDAIDPIGTFNDVVYDKMKDIFEEEKKYEKYLESCVTPIADVGIYCSMDCPVDEDENGKDLYSRIEDSRHIEITRDFAVLLKKLNIPYKIITEKNLKDLKSCKLLLASELNVLSKKEEKAIRDFVKNGGNLYASGEIATYNGEYFKCKGGLLKDVLGVEMQARENGKVYYIRPTLSAKKYFGYFTEEHPLSCGVGLRNYSVKKTKNAKVLAYMTYPYSKDGDEDAFSSAISNPPWEKSNNVAITLNKYGKGKAIYSSYPIEELKTKDQNTVLKNLLFSLLPKVKTFDFNIPSCVEVTAYKQHNSGKTVVNLLNDQMAEDNLPVNNITIKMKTDNKPKSLYSVTDGKKQKFKYKDGYLSFTVDKIVDYKMFIF